MEIVLIVFLVLIFAYQRAPENRGYHDDYLSKDSTRMLEGAFVVMVFFRHFLDYYPCEDAADKLLKTASSYMGQMLVIPFLFITGYGTMASIERRGFDYVREIPRRKFLKLLLQFDVCVMLFVAYQRLIGVQYTPKRILLALTGWYSVGNSSWYVVTILVFYLAVYLAFRWIKNRPASVALVAALLFAYIFIIKDYKRMHWYNTALVLPLGMVYCLLKEPIDRFMRSRDAIYPVVISLLVVAFAFLKQYAKQSFLVYEAWACVFALLLVVKAMKLKLNNRFFDFLGRHVFSIYILQRIPMSFFSHHNFKPPLFGFLAAFAATVIIAVLFDACVARVERAIAALAAGRKAG